MDFLVDVFFLLGNDFIIWCYVYSSIAKQERIFIENNI